MFGNSSWVRVWLTVAVADEFCDTVERLLSPFCVTLADAPPAVCITSE